jgi:quinol-cytochrome oxidoreductase complex cytochrome b subunit
MRSDNDMRAWLQTTTGIVAVLLLVQFLTGVLLAFYYVPSVDHAYTTVSYIEKVVSSGSWIRSVHHYGSQWLSVFVFVHVIRLFWHSAYNANRTQWIAGILILGLVMAAGGTGYSLPWDARAFFSTRVAEGLMAGLPGAGSLARLWLLGGSEISPVTLSRFFALHVLVVPALIAGVVIWRLFRAQIAELFTTRDAIVGGLMFLALALWALKNPAPLGPSVAEAGTDYLPRPGAQFFWL